MHGKLPFIKVCCIASIAEAKLAISTGASALGLVGRMPSGPGPIPDETIRTIAAAIPPPVASFLLTCETTARDIIAHHQRTFTNTIQLVDAVDEKEAWEVKSNLPYVKLVPVIHVVDDASIEEALTASAYADALLLDSGNPKAQVKELGGTGRVHNWKISRSIVEQAGVPVFLAGGLHAGNARQALDAVNPYGLDLCSAIRTEGRLDAAKLEAFFKAAGY